MQKEKIKHKTSKSHYEKYAKLKKDCGISYKERNPFCTKEEIIAAYKRDPVLNNIPLIRFDAYYGIYSQYARRAGHLDFSLSENTCLAKHCLIYDVVGAEPDFQEEGFFHGRSVPNDD
jgi:hypothetical protein